MKNVSEPVSQGEIISGSMLKWFIVLFLFHPTFYFGMLVLTIGIHSLLPVLKLVLSIAPFMFLGTLLIVRRYTRILKNSLASVRTDDKAKEDKDKREAINSYPLKVALCLGIGNSIGTIAGQVLGMYWDVFLSMQQNIFFFTLGELTVLADALTIYYLLKTKLYPASQFMKYKPLSMFYKFSIPVFSTIVWGVTVMSIAVYSSSYRYITLTSSRSIAADVEQKTMSGEYLILKTLGYLDDLSDGINLRQMDQASAVKAVNEISANNGIDARFFTADINGKVTGNLPDGTDNASVKDIFAICMKEKSQVISDPVYHAEKKGFSLYAAIPLPAHGNNNSIAGVYLFIDAAKYLPGAYTGGSSRSLFARDGRLIFDTAATGGLSATPDGELGKFIHGDENYAEVPLNGKAMIAFRGKIPSIKGEVIYLENKESVLSTFSYLLAQMVIFMIPAIAVIVYILYRITSRISTPINKSITIFESISRGDLTVKTMKSTPDQFGILINSMNEFIPVLKSTIKEALDSSHQLFHSTSVLAGTGNDLSGEAQNQAAAVEQATASLEGISSSADVIGDNIRKQSLLSEASFNSMGALKDIVLKISSLTDEASVIAASGTKEADRGTGLMKKTIEGMSYISNSTSKISEMVNLISDVSDQVNLLSLNAAIEAARAGEQGRGFAVVADEISKLADLTAKSAQDIRGFVKQSISEVEKGRAYADETAEAFEKIIEYILKTDKMVEVIRKFSDEQKSASDQVLENTKNVMIMAESIYRSTEEQMVSNSEMIKSINQINEHTQSVASGAEELAAVSEEIKARAESLSTHIRFFKV